MRPWVPAHGTAVSGTAAPSGYRRPDAVPPTPLSAPAASLQPPQQPAQASNLRPQTGAPLAWDSPGRELQGWLALRRSCERCPPPRSPLRVRPRLEPSRQSVPPPAPPSRAARAGNNAERARSRLQSFCSARSSGNKRGGGAELEQHVGGGGAAVTRTPVAFPPHPSSGSWALHFFLFEGWTVAAA